MNPIISDSSPLPGRGCLLGSPKNVDRCFFSSCRSISCIVQGQEDDNSLPVSSIEVASMILASSCRSASHIRIHLRIHVRVGRETERLVSRFPGLMDRQVNKRIANSPQRNYRRIRRPRWPTVSAKTIDKRAHLPFMKRSREETSRPSRIATISSSFSSSPLSLSFSSLHTCLPICPFDLFSSSLPPSLSLSVTRSRSVD